MRAFALASVLLVAACASSTGQSGTPPGSGPGTVVDRVKVSGGDQAQLMDAAVQSTKFVSSQTIGKSVDDVWAVLPDIWSSLGLTVDGISSKDHRLTSGVIKVRRTLGNVSLSRYVECGRSTMGANADSYFISLKVETVLSASGTSTLVQSALQATGEGVGNGGQVMRCSSTGELENRIGERLQKRLQ
jgi:hypothetical protein